MDICDFNPPQGSYDAASVYFSLIASVSQAGIRRQLAKVYHFLRPGGFFVFATVPEDAENVQLKWMGRPVTISSLDVDGVVLLTEGIRFKIVHKSITKFMPKGEEAGVCEKSEVWEEPHLFVYARKPEASITVQHSVISPCHPRQVVSWYAERCLQSLDSISIQYWMTGHALQDISRMFSYKPRPGRRASHRTDVPRDA